MRQIIDGDRVYTAYQPNELGNPLTASTNHPRGHDLAKLIRLLGGGGKNGPLMVACLRGAEHRGYGGHRHMLTGP